MEREVTAEKQLIVIAHCLKNEGIVPNAAIYEEFVKKMRPDPLHGRTIEEALKNGNRQEVYEFARFLASEPFI